VTADTPGSGRDRRLTVWSRRTVLFGASALVAQPALGRDAAPGLDAMGFRALLNQVAKGWNSGDALLAAAAFAEDAIYTEPPDRQRYVGRAALVRFFAGDGQPKRMTMTWHYRAFDDAAQVGFGEYSFALPDDGFQAHGITTVAVRDGLIASWREYQTRSSLPFETFAGGSLLRQP